MSKSLDKLASELNIMGHSISPNSVRKLSTETGFSRQVNRKGEEGTSHPDCSSSYCVSICERHNLFIGAFVFVVLVVALSLRGRGSRS